MCSRFAMKYKWSAVVHMMRTSVTTCIGRVGNEEIYCGGVTHSNKKKYKETGIVTTPNTVIDPLTVVITTVYAIVALRGSIRQSKTGVATTESF
jgi:hypothetical protein